MKYHLSIFLSAGLPAAIIIAHRDVSVHFAAKEAKIGGEKTERGIKFLVF